jgi:hypothetical protein
MWREIEQGRYIRGIGSMIIEAEKFQNRPSVRGAPGMQVVSQSKSEYCRAWEAPV